jgi:hypothetical protein
MRHYSKYSDVACRWCGKEFHQIRPKNFYCSNLCYLSARHGRQVQGGRPNHREIFVCPMCGTEFETWASQNPTYCSRACNDRAHTNQKTYNCERCGKAFQRAVSVKNVHWCSRACYYAVRADPAVREATFWKSVDRSSENGCWPWIARSLMKGYGYYGKPKVLAHRFAWEISRGRALPEGSIILHLCDNRRCCRPDHLLEGTHQSNVDDKMHKGRHRNGIGDEQPLGKTTHVQTSMVM